MSKILIIGNGFDINLGLKTSYSDFIHSVHFQKLIDDENNLAERLKTIHGDKNWVDIEHELKSYVFNHETFINDMTRAFIHDQIQQKKERKLLLESLKGEFIALKNALADYLKHEMHKILPKKRSTQAWKIISLGYLGCIDDYGISFRFSDIFTFNYTNPLYSNELVSINDDYNIHYVHGSLNDNNIVFGVEDGAISLDHSYLNKSDHAAFGEAPDVSAAIINAEEVHFFGCSLGDTDNAHFKRAFKTISSSDLNHSRIKIYFYIYGKEGYRSIYNRIMALTENHVSEFKLINKVTFYDLKEDKKIDQEWLNQ